ncbi:hypothetical protein CH256_25170 [Rhodococcus sp. 05-2254-6]|uniref:hypothetical protein n=1 Tax=unclassified Rhodococcus (in: high G+C Gram-positive bacteria) TaxID=192944 RepID=UPI000B9B24A9|nr:MULTISPECIES: hypothetical protein [unclassified Rhodococcus (in: high G+C Gram-positive bacteria)]OZE19613.1 hypothetical protein CH256_25170 [Rhodococcus sp. 05-2254-6]OZF51336.1 hypothetical protein CH291_07170 [Rhodococcus sp. 14-1411-2a]
MHPYRAMRFRLIADRWRWRAMREFLRRNRIDAALSVEQRVNDYLAVADAFGLTWPRDETRLHALLLGFGESDPSAVSGSIRENAASMTLCSVVPLRARATD